MFFRALLFLALKPEPAVVIYRDPLVLHGRKNCESLKDVRRGQRMCVASGSGNSGMTAGASTDQVKVDVVAERSAQALGFPYYLAQTFHDFVSRVMRTNALRQSIVCSPNPRWLVNR